MVPAFGARVTIRIPLEADATFSGVGFRCASDAP
jgi:hypothetical protein